MVLQGAWLGVGLGMGLGLGLGLVLGLGLGLALGLVVRQGAVRVDDREEERLVRRVPG